MNVFLRLLVQLTPFRWLLALTVLLGTIMVASNMILLGMAAYLIAEAAVVSLMAMLSLPTGIVRLVSLSRSVSRYGERLVSHDLTFRLLTRLRSHIYHRLEPLAPAFLTRYHSGDLHTRLLADIEELQTIYLRAVAPILVALMISGLTFLLLMIFSPLLAWVAFGFLALTGIGVPALVAWLSRHMGERQLALRAELKTQLVEGLQGMPDLLAYGGEGKRQHTIAHIDQQLARVQQRMVLIEGMRQAVNDLMANLAMVTIVILAIPLVVSQAIPGVYLGFLALVMLASFEAVHPLSQAFQSLGRSLAAGKRLFEIVDAAPAISSPSDPLPVPVGRTLAFEGVSFVYPSDEAEVLQDITLSVSSGQRIALVGPSGSGKSTLARLAVRFWEPTKGVIRLDDQPLGRYALPDIRTCISLVDQETYLFNDTLRANLVLGKPSASADEIERVLEQAQLSEFVRRLPQGLETWIGEQGVRLSGGERQRVAIARALLKNAPLLILDEVTANLDPQTEQALLRAFEPLMQGRATLMITHRLIGMERMDEILVLDQGRIVERGTHAHLLAKCGRYRVLFEAQRDVLALI